MTIYTTKEAKELRVRQRSINCLKGDQKRHRPLQMGKTKGCRKPDGFRKVSEDRAQGSQIRRQMRSEAMPKVSQTLKSSKYFQHTPSSKIVVNSTQPDSTMFFCFFFLTTKKCIHLIGQKTKRATEASTQLRS